MSSTSSNKKKKQHPKEEITIDVQQEHNLIPVKLMQNNSSNSGSNNSKIHRAYHDGSLDSHIKNICWMVVFIACVALVLVLALCAHPDLLTSNDRIHILAVVLPIYGISMVALFFVRKETKALLVVLVIKAMVIGYLLAYTSQSVMKRSEINCN